MGCSPSLYFGHGGFNWDEERSPTEEVVSGVPLADLPGNARAVVRTLGKFGAFEWNNDGQRSFEASTIIFSPMTNQELDRRKHPHVTLKLALDAMWRLRFNKLVAGETTLPSSPKLANEEDEGWVGIFLKTHEDADVGNILALPAVLAELILEFV